MSRSFRLLDFRLLEKLLAGSSAQSESQTQSLREVRT